MEEKGGTASHGYTVCASYAHAKIGVKVGMVDLAGCLMGLSLGFGGEEKKQTACSEPCRDHRDEPERKSGD